MYLYFNASAGVLFSGASRVLFGGVPTGESHKKTIRK